jgi:hypothetical protein
MREAAKCAHEACACTVPANSPFGKYCSDHCREAHRFTAFRCMCHHDACDQPTARDSGEAAHKSV